MSRLRFPRAFPAAAALAVIGTAGACQALSGLDDLEVGEAATTTSSSDASTSAASTSDASSASGSTAATSSSSSGDGGSSASSGGGEGGEGSATTGSGGAGGSTGNGHPVTCTPDCDAGEVCAGSCTDAGVAEPECNPGMCQECGFKPSLGRSQPFCETPSEDATACRFACDGPSDPPPSVCAESAGNLLTAHLNTAATDMTLVCGTMDSCDDAEVQCFEDEPPTGPESGPHPCNVECGDAACMGLTLDCRASTGVCSLSCTANGTCSGATVECGPNECRVSGCDIPDNDVVIRRNGACALVIDGENVDETGTVGSCTVL